MNLLNAIYSYKQYNLRIQVIMSYKIYAIVRHVVTVYFHNFQNIMHLYGIMIKF